MLITSLPVDVKIQIITLLVSWHTVKTFLDAIPSMAPLLRVCSSSIAKSIPKLPYEQRELEPFMDAILAAHFSKPLRTADEMKSFMDYHFPGQQTPDSGSPSSPRRPAFPHDIESIDYLITVRLALEYFWRCVQVEHPTVWTSGRHAWVPPAFLRLQLHAEIFHPSAGKNDNNPELPEMLRIFWSKFSQHNKESCEHIYATMIQLLHYISNKREIGRKFFQFPDAPFEPQGVPRLEVLCKRGVWRPFSWDWETGEGEFKCRKGLYDDEIDVYGERELAIVDNMYNWWYETEYRTKFFKRCLDNFEQRNGQE